jgi:hypothetical protein
MTPPAPPAHSFILRVWLEPRQGAAPGEWRGELKHVPSGTTAYFRTFESLPPLLHRLVGQHAVDADVAEAG